VSGQETPGLVFDLASDPAPASGDAWGSLREIGGWWGLMKFLPSAVRMVFSDRESVGGLPVVEPGQTRPAELPEVDFDPGVPTGDHTPTAETSQAEQVAEQAAEQAAEQVCEASLAQQEAGYEAGTGPYTPELTGDSDGAGPAVNGHAAGAATAQAEAVAVAELGEVGL
jgi:hypothetical protein